MTATMTTTMTTGLKIKQVANASGFTTATLRYYEQIGLLPPSLRTAAGYRTYDERTLTRLAFIARSKQLGCTLDEITGLSAAWDGGQCGPVQDQLRQLVADKIAAAETQIAELTTFIEDLRSATTALERHRPDGACDANCGCVSEPSNPTASTAATIRSVELSAKPQPAGAPDIACTLSAGSMNDRIADWNRLLVYVARRDVIEGEERIGAGIRCTLAAGAPTAELMRLVAAEQHCCQFLRFAITVDSRGVALEVRAPGEAESIVTAMFGEPS